jgi:hypothetical protein
MPPYTIIANGKAYTVSLHAANRMLQRGITEVMVVATLENGTIRVQERDTDLYEYQWFDASLQDYIIVQVVVD